MHLKHPLLLPIIVLQMDWLINTSLHREYQYHNVRELVYFSYPASHFLELY